MENLPVMMYDIIYVNMQINVKKRDVRNKKGERV